ncbi:unnamed protein product [Spirodela intermedia]|uniref:Uncharacterized protein n=2 Tax=Spirodela intermedia TaxID=51605 RepID=A0A7I8J504_SPIIN|nr:unnamed protein product [Spirodela intermedia]CAA6665328.1 unnamed protein product [Spirodela intermedia]CAA7402056.1 unnamed protein product [Spirodela intermedia]
MASEFAEDFSGFPAIHFSGSFLGLDAAAMEDSGSLGLAGYSGYGFSEAHLDDLPVSLPAQCPVQDPLPFIQAGKRRKSVTVPCGAAAPGGAASAGVKTKKKDIDNGKDIDSDYVDC